MTNNQTVTFQTRLDTKRETEKAFKVDGGSWLPKSLVTAEITGEYAPHILIARVTMPKWLANKL